MSDGSPSPPDNVYVGVALRWAGWGCRYGRGEYSGGEDAEGERRGAGEAGPATGAGGDEESRTSSQRGQTPGLLFGER